MHGHTSFEIRIEGNDENVNAINGVIRNIITDGSFDEGSEIEIEETYKCVDLEEITDMAIDMAQSAPDASFEMKGIIDTSESAGELMDFAFAYRAGELSRQASNWYIETCIEDYESYDEFMEDWEDEAEEMTEEQFEAFKDENDFLFFVETENGMVPMSDVPLTHIDTIDIH